MKLNYVKWLVGENKVYLAFYYLINCRYTVGLIRHAVSFEKLKCRTHFVNLVLEDAISNYENLMTDHGGEILSKFFC